MGKKGEKASEKTHQQSSLSYPPNRIFRDNCHPLSFKLPQITGYLLLRLLFVQGLIECFEVSINGNEIGPPIIYLNDSGKYSSDTNCLRAAKKASADMSVCFQVYGSYCEAAI